LDSVFFSIGSSCFDSFCCFLLIFTSLFFEVSFEAICFAVVAINDEPFGVVIRPLCVPLLSCFISSAFSNC
jgi:hypothetical protein